MKGDRIGESLTDYLAVVKGSAENAARALTDCATLLSSDHKHRRKRAFEAEICLQMSNVLLGQTVLLSGRLGGALGTPHFQFVDRKLVMIALTIPDTFAKVERDLIANYGPPDSEEQVPYQNGFGAVFLHPRATWVKRSDVMVVASEDSTVSFTGYLGEAGAALEKDGVLQVYTIRVAITDRSWAQSIADKELNRPSSIN